MHSNGVRPTLTTSDDAAAPCSQCVQSYKHLKLSKIKKALPGICMFDKNSNETEPNRTERNKQKSMVSWSWVLSTLFYILHCVFFTSSPLSSSSSILIFVLRVRKKMWRCDAVQAQELHIYTNRSSFAHHYF